MEVQRFDVLAVLYELHEAQLVVFIHEVDDLVQQLFAVAASDGIAGVGAGGADPGGLCRHPAGAESGQRIRKKQSEAAAKVELAKPAFW